MSAETTTRGDLHGLMAEFDSRDALVEACERTHEAGYRKVDAYSPYPIEEVSEALHHPRSPLSKIVFAGGLLGACAGFGLQYWVSVIHYPLNVGGRPLNSWPSFIPVTFETTILLAALATVIGMLALNGLPRPYHPVFNVKAFERASQDRFFLCIESEDPRFDIEETRRFLHGLGALEVHPVDA